MRKFCVLIFAILFVCGCAATAQLQDINPQSEPGTLEEKVAQADTVLLGTVQSVQPAQERDLLDRQPAREPYVATVRVEELYKGAAGAQSVTVQFTRSHRSTRPPLVDLQPGDRAVLFLKSPRGSANLELVSPFYGKDEPGAALLQDLRTMSEEQGLAADVDIAIFLEASTAAPGAPAPVRVRITNKSTVPVIFGATPAPGQVLIVIGPDGRGLAMRPGARDHDAARIPLYLPGSGVFEYRADLAQFFDLSRSGAYTVQAVFDPPAASGAWSGALRSQNVALAVQ